MHTLEEILAVIEEKIRPGLQMDGGDVDVIDYKDNKLYVKLTGACGGCPMATVTLQFGIFKVLKEHFPELEEVVQV